jgi:hypothetical protein
MEMNESPRCYMARPGEKRLTPMVDPGGQAFLLPLPPEEIDPMSGWSLALDSESPPVRSAARAIFGLHHDVDTGPLRCETTWAVELRRHEFTAREFAGQTAHRFVVYARTAAEARQAAVHSADLLVYTSPKPSRASDPG